MGLQRKMERDLQRDTKIGEQGLWKKKRDIGGYDFIEGEIDCRLKVQKEREILTVRGQREKEIKGQGLETKREILSVRVYRERERDIRGQLLDRKTKMENDQNRERERFMVWALEREILKVKNRLIGCQC